MAMTAEQFESLMTRLNNADLPHDERTDILTELRADYTKVIQDEASFKTTIESNTTKINQLVQANSKLFLSQSIDDDNNEHKKQEEAKTFSETVTIADLTK